MAMALEGNGRTSGLGWIATPLGVFGIALLGLVGLLLVPLRLPLGPMYWDLFVYFDAAQRILLGQMPSADFYAPVGPLGYYLFTGGATLFPNAQPLLLVQWSILLVTAPVMALVLRDVSERSTLDAWSLLVPFLAFSILPFNSLAFSVYPGVDGFGIYNRHESYLLYVLACVLVFVRSSDRQLVALAVLMPALFLTKVTGFVVAGLLCAFAFAAGRVRLRTAILVAASFATILAAIELLSGIVSAYVADILFLLGGNSGTLLPRFVSVASQNFGVLAPAGLLVLMLAWLDLPRLRQEFRRARGIAAFAALLDRDWMWLGVLLFCGMTFETQNTGSQSFLLVWPALYLVLRRAFTFPLTTRVLAIALVAFCAVPTASGLLHGAARAGAAELANRPLEAPHLKTLGSVSAKDIFFDQAALERDYFVAHRGEEVPAPINDPSSHRPFSEIDFQLLWLQSVDEAVATILDYEAANNVRFESIFSLNFVNPFPWLLDRAAPKYVSIGAVPERTARTLDPKMSKAIGETDLILVPLCTASNLSRELFVLYADAFPGRHQISLTPCYDAYVRPGLIPGL